MPNEKNTQDIPQQFVRDQSCTNCGYALFQSSIVQRSFFEEYEINLLEITRLFSYRYDDENEV